jgi:leucyl aminopeptidase (aminopeptidase T)
MVRNARILFEVNCVPGDNAVIITDSDMDPHVWQSIAAAGNDYGCQMTVMFMADPREYHGAPPPSSVIEASKNARICISNTSKEYHTGGFHRVATAAGAGWIVMEQVTAGILSSGVCEPEVYREMIKVAPDIYKKLNEGGLWHITSDSGTDYKVQAKQGGGRIETPKVVGAPWVPGGLVAFPAGEIAGTPIPGTGEGTVVWDTTVHHPPGLLREPIRLTIQKGVVKKIDGGLEAQQLKDFIKKYGDELTYNFDVELSVGWNPRCPFTGNFRTDKKRYGKIHTAMGPLQGFGGPVGSKLHVDGVTRDVSITIDGKTFVERGRIKFPPLDTWPERFPSVTL